MRGAYPLTYFSTCGLLLFFVSITAAVGMTEGELAICQRLESLIALGEFMRHGVGWLLGGLCGLAAVHRFFV